jgi:hypothetical protein
MALEVGEGGGERTPKARTLNEKECESPRSGQVK